MIALNPSKLGKRIPIFFKKRFFLLLSLSLVLACTNEDNDVPSKGELVSFSFLKVHNPGLESDVIFQIEGDKVKGEIDSYEIAFDSLIASYEFEGAAVSVGNEAQVSGTTANDFTKDISYTIVSEDNSVSEYDISLSFTPGLPMIFVSTVGNQPIDTLKNYREATINFFGNTKFANFQSDAEIKTRGNSTLKLPKKPYQIKFGEKAEVFGMPEDKKWILLANYTDKTMLRNKTAFEMGHMSQLQWTPQSVFAELFVNREYVGTYQLTQKVEITSNRVDIGDEGFLIESDSRDRLDEDDVFFVTDRELFNIKEPDVERDGTDFLFVKKRITEIENVLFSDDFKNETTGYRKYLDVESFVDWYLINELSKNNDAIFYSSTYLHLQPGEKLKMGPLWDFDIAFGNINYNGNETPEGFWIKNAPWMTRLFEDPYFVKQVKSRFEFFKNNKAKILEQISANANMLQAAQEKNEARWQTLGRYVWPNFVFFDTYDEETEYLKNWIDQRFLWMDTALNAL